MASPQEVIEVAINHPADSTPESRRAASTQVMRALAANEYGFFRRRLPISEIEDGQCPTCKVESVHVDHGEAYMDALFRMAAMQRKIDELLVAVRAISNGAPNPQEIARKVAY